MRQVTCTQVSARPLTQPRESFNIWLTHNLSAFLKHLEHFKAQDHCNIDYQIENTTFIESRARVLLSYGPVTPGDNPESVTVVDEVEEFVGGDDADEFGSEAAGLIQFCTPDIVKPTRPSRPAGPSYVALLDDKSRVGAQTKSRPYPGPLTSDELFKLLKRPRFRHRKNAPSSAASTSNSPDSRRKFHEPTAQAGRVPDKDKLPAPISPSQGSTLSLNADLEVGSTEPDADRRIVFITDIDSLTARVLIRTVSSNHVRALRDALYNHLAAESIIAATITKGLVMFKLSFHLPFFALRCSLTPRKDHRLYDGEMPLRNTKDISFLNWHDQGSRSLVELHEAHVSFVISGFHDSCWVAHCFVDTYYDDDDDKGKECVEDYAEQATISQGMAADAPTLGSVDCDQPIWNPREYFIHVVYFRLLKAKSEWQSLHKATRGSFRRYTQSYDRSLLPQRMRSHARDHEHGRKTPQKNLDLLMQYLSLFSKLDESLTEIIDSYETFRNDSMDFFVDFQQPAHGGASLAGVRSIFEGLKKLKKKFEVMEREGSQIKGALELILTREAFENNKGQSRVVRYMTPIAMTTSVFSMQKMNIPLVQQNFAWFLGLLGIFSMMTFGGHIFKIVFLRLSDGGKTIGDYSSLWIDLSLRARRRKKGIIGDIENGMQVSTNAMNEVSSRGNGHCHCSHEAQSAFCSGMSTPPSTFIASHQQINEVAPRGSHLIRQQGTLE